MLFLDDLRDPVNNEFTVCRTSQEAIDLLYSMGVPQVISFDHDLGGDDTSMVYINHLINGVLDNRWTIPSGFIYYIHSANPVGSVNIESKMSSFLRYLESI